MHIFTRHSFISKSLIFLTFYELVLIVYGHSILVRGNSLYILIDANGGNCRYIPNIFEFLFKSSANSQILWYCIISQPLNYTESHMFDIMFIISGIVFSYRCECGLMFP